MHLYIALIVMSSFLILCDLWMILGLTVQPNKLYDKYFNIDNIAIKQLQQNLAFVGKHASKIHLNDFSLCVDEMKQIYATNITRPVSNRKKQLKILLKVLRENEQLIMDAATRDLQRTEFLSAGEIYMIKNDIKSLLNNIDELSAPKRIQLSTQTFPSSEYHIFEPYGTVLIIGTWNFALNLSLGPLVAAIAAGNNVVLKLSNQSSECAKLICNLLHKYMDCRFIQCIGHPNVANGSDNAITSKLLQNEFDLIFFTGSSEGGKYIQKEASKFMTPVVLECGGKNPCVIDDSCDIAMAARTICNTRIWNCGQWCIAPDYVLIYKNILNKFLFECNKFISDNYKMGNELHTDLAINQAKFINRDKFDRVKNMLKRTNGKIICGGNDDEKTLMMEPTIVLLSEIKKLNKKTEPTINEETFGPILWVVPIESNSIQDAIDFINKQQKSLALYIFSKNRKNINMITNNTSSGGVQINGCVTYFTHPGVIFGGVGNSGQGGGYHGLHGFYAFSHKKPVLRSWFEWGFILQPPYPGWKKKLLAFVWCAY
eukprot:364054_1